MEQDWNEEFFGCFTDPTVFIIACIIPCGICGLQSFAVKNTCIGGTLNRESIRKSLHIKGSFTNSLLNWVIFPLCAVIQEYNEVKSTHIIFLDSDPN